MSDMPGNPYYDDAESYAEDSHFHEGENDLRRMQVSLQRADLASQLALAYEQRTANMIASREFIAVTDHEIEQRLGRHDDQ